MREDILGQRRFEGDLRFDPTAAAEASAHEASIWSTLVIDQRRVGREPYEALALRAPVLRANPSRMAFIAGEEPARVRRGKGTRVPGRRPSHASNATRS